MATFAGSPLREDSFKTSRRLRHVDFAQANGRNVDARIYIETEIGNYLRPRVEVAGNVSDMIVRYNQFRGIYAKAIQDVRQATAPAECRTIINAVTYPTL